MLISPEEAELFLTLYSSVIGFAAGRSGGIEGRGSIRESYRQAKAAGIITSLDPDWKSEKPTPAKKPKTPAIYRFLKKKCPKTVEEFKQKYGEPRMDLVGEAACEYSLWSIDGTPLVSTWSNINHNKYLPLNSYILAL